MLTTTYDSELMVQQVAAVAVPSCSSFFTVADENCLPMVFSVGTDQKFYLIKEDVEGAHSLSDFGSLLRLAEDYVAHSLSVTQDADSNIFIVLAIEDKSATDADPNRMPSIVKVFRPFKPEDYDLASPSTDLSSLILPQKGESENFRAWTIFAARSTGGASYPPVFVSSEPLDYINKKEDLSRIAVKSDLTDWSLACDVQLPEDASKILGLQPLVVPFGDDSMSGLAMLYILQNAPELIFMSTDGTFQVSLECPEAAQCLGSFVNEDNFTDLLVGGSALRHFKAIECLRKNSTGTEVTNQPPFKGIQEISVAQASSDLTIWASNDRSSVGYLRASIDLATVASPIPVIPERQGGRFSVFKSNTEGYEQLIVSDSAGALSLIRHDPALGFWKPTPFYTPTLDKIVDVRCYTMQTSVLDENKKPYANSEVLLKSSGYADVLVNGLSVQASPTGVPAVTDQEGLLTIIIPTDGIESNTFSVTALDDDKSRSETSKDALPLDPTGKVYDALAKIQNGDDLKNARTQTGQSVIQNPDLSDDDIDQAAKAIATSVSARESVMVKSGTIAKPRVALPTQNVRFGHNIEKLGKGPRGILDWASDAWNWFKGLVGDVVAWAIEFAEGAYHFLATIGEETYRWALDTLEMIGNALSWVFEKILEIVETVIEWIGFIFNWGDIQATHRSIVALTNSALDAWAERALLAPDVIEAYIDGLSNVIKGQGNKPLPGALGSAPADNDTVDSSRSKNSATDSTKVKWSQYQCTHGGAFKGSVVHNDSVKAGGGTPFVEFWTDVVAPLIDAFGKVAHDIGASIFEIFNPLSSITPEQVLKKLGTELLLDLLEGIKKVGSGLAKLGASLLDDFKTAINYKITIPVFSALYKTFISGGSDLTVLDGLALILAIPVTILSKLITGKTPPDLTNVNYADLVDGNVSKETTMQFNRFANSTTLCCRPIISAIEMVESIFGLRSRFEVGKTKHLLKFSKRRLRPQPIGKPADLAKKYWQDVFAVVATLATIPRDPDLPGYDVRWGSWAVSALNRGTSMALRRVDSTTSALLHKGLGVQKVILGAVNFGLIIAVKVEEFENDFPDKVEALTVLDCVSGTFDLVSCTCDGAATFDPDPDTAAALAFASTVTTVFSVVVCGSTYIVRVADGQYNDMLSVVF